jgi:protein SCO1
MPCRAGQDECHYKHPRFVSSRRPLLPNLVIPVEKEHGAIFQPIFISVDPARDSIPQVARYLTDFHPRFIGLIGDYNSIKSVCKAYRVYFSTPPNADPNGDYLVDHSIYIYLMDPKGEFVEAFGQVSTVDEIVSRVQKEMELWTSERKLPSVKPR